MGEVTIGGRTFSLEDKLLKKINILMKRVTVEHPKQDSFLAIDSKTGGGKTNTSLIISGLVSKELSRKINLFFTTKSALTFAKATEKQLIILDEPSLDMMARDWASDLAKNFLRLLNTMRRKRHFFIVNLANFWIFPEALVVDRLNGLIHMNPKQLGRAVWVRPNRLESLWNDYKKRHERNFNKYKSFRMYFPRFIDNGGFEALDISVEGHEHATYDQYEDLKDLATESIDKKPNKDKNLMKLLQLRLKIARVDWRGLGLNKSIIASKLGIDPKRLQEWIKIDLNNPNIDGIDEVFVGKTDFEESGGSKFNISRDNLEEIQSEPEEDEDLDDNSDEKPDENDDDKL